jgi:multiple sugar transport system ATP-binding protein
MRVELSKIKAHLGTTFIYVTHDQTEAMTLADKIVVLRDGRVEQVGAPMDLYERPANRFVAGFIGSPRMNFFDARTVEPWARAPAGLTLGIRPEHVRLVDPFRAHLLGRVVMTERLGGETYLHADTPGGTAIVKVDGDSALRVGDNVGLAVPRDRAHFFAADGARLPVPEYRQSRELQESSL